MGGQVLEHYDDKCAEKKVNESIRKERIKTTKVLISFGLSDEEISKATSLSVEEIEELRKQ